MSRDKKLNRTQEVVSSILISSTIAWLVGRRPQARQLRSRLHVWQKHQDFSEPSLARLKVATAPLRLTPH